MGQRGPAPKPPELKALEGGRGHRPINLDQIFRPEVGVPTVPKYISREGRKAWKRLTPELARYNLISLLDADALEELCETIGLLKVLRRSINARQEQLLADKKDPAHAIEGSTPNGMIVQSVTYQAMNREREKLRSMLAEFGLTPAQRARVTTAIRTQIPLFDANAQAGGQAQGGFAGFPGMKASYLERLTAYARRVVDGVEVAGLLERLACERFFGDLARQGTDEFPYVIDERLGNRECYFLELLPHIKGEWAKPVYIDGKLWYAKIVLEDWQLFIEFQLFAWVHRDTRLRRFRRSYEEIARKNAKSTRGAGRQLYLLTADGEPGAHCYSAATTGDQAREVFDVARNMALREPEFLKRFGVDVGKHDITVPDTASSFKPLNAEGSTLDGLNVHGGLVDEVHAHKKRDLWDVLDTATGARSQALLSAITTAGSDRSGICCELRDYTVKVLKRVVIDETWFGIIFTIDEGDLWHDPACWRKPNPNLGISVKVDDMEAQCRKALAMPSAQAGFLTKRLNVWVNSDSAWMDMQAWDRCADRSLTVDKVKHLPVWIPLDLASKVDVAAAPKLFYDQADDHYYLVSRFYLPERAVESGRNSQYDGWRRGGHLKVTDGEVIDFDVIEDDLRADICTLQVQELPFDPWQATQLATRLLNEGAPMVEYRQTVQNMSEPMKTLEALVLQGKLTHDGNPMMTWMVSNVVCHRDAKDNVFPRKEREENKIDGPVAAIMGIGRRLSAAPAFDLDDIIANPMIN